MKDLLLFGIQWSGKWTQSALLQKEYPWLYSYFSTWDIFRAINSTDNAIGNYVKDRIATWQLINDKVTLALFDAYMQTVIDESKNMLLDWFPRTIPQMEVMMDYLQQAHRDVIGIQFVISDDVAMQRMKERWRSDDTDVTIRHRLEQFHQKTQPVIDRFEKHWTLIKINAERKVSEIFEDLDRVIKATK